MIIEKNDIKPGAQELVTLPEAQIYFRSENSGGIEDSLITNLISAARSYIERKTNLSLIARELDVFFFEGYKGYIPFGPVDGEITFTPTDSATLQGSAYPYLNVKADTVASYSTKAFQDAQIKQAILELAFFYYERGMFEKNIPRSVLMTIRQFSRNTLI